MRTEKVILDFNADADLSEPVIGNGALVSIQTPAIDGTEISVQATVDGENYQTAVDQNQNDLTFTVNGSGDLIKLNPVDTAGYYGYKIKTTTNQTATRVYTLGFIDV